MPFGIGPLELIVVLIIVLMVFGSKRLPEMGRGLGQGMREFKDSVTGSASEDERAQPKLEAGPAQPKSEAKAAQPESTVSTGAAPKPDDPFGRG